jgi:hypothetical protein
VAKFAGVIDLFPTRIFKFRVNPELIKSTVKHKKEGGSNHTYDEVFNHSEFLPLQEEVLSSVSSFCPRGLEGMNRIGKWKIVSGWINNQSPGQTGFSYHGHAESFMSCVVYLEGKDMSLNFRDESRLCPADETGESSYDLLVRHRWHEDANIPAEVGDVILFPSYLLHKPNTNETDVDRISIAYNLMPTRITPPNSPPWSIRFDV